MFSKRLAIARLEPDSIRYTLIERSGMSGRVIEEGRWRAEPETSLPDTLVKALQAKNAGMVRLELPLNNVVIHVIEMPAIKKRSDIKKAVPFELERKMPISLDNFYWSFSILESGGERTRVLTAGVRRKYLSPFIERLSKGGIAIGSIELGALSFLGKLKPADDVFYLGLSENSFDLTVVKQGRPAMLKSIERPSVPEASLEAIASAIRRDIEQHQCDRVEIYGPVDKFELEKIGALLPTSVSSLGHTAARSIIADKLGEFLPVKVSPVKDLKNDSAIGKRTPSGPFRLDLLPDGLRRKRDPHNIILAVLLACLMVSFYFQGYEKTRKDSLALEEINLELEELRERIGGKVEEVSGTLKEHERVIRSLMVLRPYFSGRNRPIVAIKELNKIIPKNTWIVNFIMDGKGKLEIDGYSTHSSDLVRLIEKSDKFTGAEMAGPIKMQQLGEHFSIRMYWEDTSERVYEKTEK